MFCIRFTWCESVARSGLSDDYGIAVDGPDGVTACGTPISLVPSVHDRVEPVDGRWAGVSRAAK